MPQLSGLNLLAGLSIAAALVSPAAAGALSAPRAPDSSAFLPITQVLVFGKNSRQSPEQFAAAENLNTKEVKRAHAASGLVECGEAHGAGQLTLVGNVITTASHVFYDEKGALRGASCTFAIEIEGRSVRVPVDLTSIKAGSTNPYAFPAVHDWAVAKLTKTITEATPYQLSDSVQAQTPIEFVARGHIDWGDGRRMSMEACRLHDQLSVGQEGTREFSFDCETGDGASGGAVLMGEDQMQLGAILVGWRSNKPYRAVPFSPTHYNFAVSIEGAFRTAVLDAAKKMVAGQR
ncbi:MAG: serine protease [Methylobacteriaceae bacterium]|nr:serine protease [Methylobacteriaceae bacterium]